MHDNCRFCLNTIGDFNFDYHAALAEMNRTLHHYLPHCLHLEDFDVQRACSTTHPSLSGVSTHLPSPAEMHVFVTTSLFIGRTHKGMPLRRKYLWDQCFRVEVSQSPVTKTCLWDMADKHCEFGQH